MAIFKEVWDFFNASDIWSEVYYTSQSSLDNAATFSKPFIDGRLRMLAATGGLSKIIVSDVANPRVTVPVDINRAGMNGVPAAGVADAEAAIVLQLRSTAKDAKRFLWLRGFTEGDVSRDPTSGVPALSPIMRVKVINWVQLLNLNNYIIHKLYRVGDTIPKYNRITTVDGTSANGLSVLTTQNAPGVVANDRIIISQMPGKDLPYLKGSFEVLAVSVSSVTVAYSTPGNVLVKPPAGKFRVEKYRTDTRIDGDWWRLANLGSRQTKNGETGSRGARSAKRLRTQP
jgi:hypothetical protein